MKRISNFFISLLLVICATSCSKTISTQEMHDLVQTALDNEDYASAYEAVDLGLASGDSGIAHSANDLNDKVLKQEITSLIDTDEEGSNVAKIIYTIEDRSKCSDRSIIKTQGSEKDQIKKFYNFAISISESLENKVLTQKLKKSLDNLENKEK